jgi:hypothetical protein
VVHFSPETNLHRTGEIPPVNPGRPGSPGGFYRWLYDANGFLVKNANMDANASYNAIGMACVQDRKACPNADGSLNLYIQSDTFNQIRLLIPSNSVTGSKRLYRMVRMPLRANSYCSYARIGRTRQC